MRLSSSRAAILVLAGFLGGCGHNGLAGGPFDKETGSPFTQDDGVSFEPLPGAQRQHAMKIVDQALSQYPAGFVPSLGVAITPVRSLELDHVACAGLSNPHRILVDMGGTQEQDDYDLFCTVHHELGHVVLDRFGGRFASGEWMAQLPRAFSYRSDRPGEQTGAGSGPMGADWDIVTIRAGFLTDESKESMHEDFACVSQELFQNHELFWIAVGLSPRLRKKVELAVEFYHSVDARFTMEYFKGLAKPYGSQQRSMGIVEWGGERQKPDE